MTRALVWIRSSEGTEDDVGLDQQRRELTSLAEQHADAVDTLDLGIHTGWSLHEFPDKDHRIDNCPRVQHALKALEMNYYDYFIAWDPRRVARDEYLSQIKHSIKLGGAEIIYRREQSDDELATDVRRVVDKRVKLDEIEKSRQAIEQRPDDAWVGEAPYGLQYDDDGLYLEPDPQEFEDAIAVIHDRQDDPEKSLRTLADGRSMSYKTAGRIWERREMYLEHVDDGAAE